MSPSPLTRRFAGKTRALGYYLTLKQAMAIQRAFVEALKEEVEARYGPSSGEDANYNVPLVIPGLGSFKMKTRPAKEFPDPSSGRHAPYIAKPAARRLAFTSKWEPIDG